MEYLMHIQASLDHIENNLDTDITISDCARESGYSLYHYCRLFHLTTGISVMDYIRKRRLSKAAIEIAESSKTIKEIGYHWGFNSHENFVRAFNKLFGVSPSSFRKVKSSLNLFHSIDIARVCTPKFEDNFSVEPKFIKKPVFMLAGYKVSTSWIDNKNISDIPKMWNTYHACNLGESIPNRVNPIERYDIGICTDFEPAKQKFTYIIGVEVESFDNIPKNAVIKTIPAAEYAVFSTPKADIYTFISTIHRTWRFIYQEWLPSSGYDHAGTHEFETYCENSRTYSEDIYIPIIYTGNKNYQTEGGSKNDNHKR